jgi:hypothetical protein
MATHKFVNFVKKNVRVSITVTMCSRLSLVNKVSLQTFHFVNVSQRRGISVYLFDYIPERTPHKPVDNRINASVNHCRHGQRLSDADRFSNGGRISVCKHHQEDVQRQCGDREKGGHRDTHQSHASLPVEARIRRILQLKYVAAGDLHILSRAHAVFDKDGDCGHAMHAARLQMRAPCVQGNFFFFDK